MIFSIAQALPAQSMSCVMRRIALMAAVCFTPCLVHAFLPHASLSNSVRSSSKMLAMNSDETVSRGEVLRRVGVACVGGGSLLNAAVIDASAKAPVMRLPDDEATTPARGYAGNENSVVPPFKTLPSGLQITDIKVGDGPEAAPGKGVVVQWVLRRMNGYYVSASSEGDGEPFIYRVGDEKRAIKGFDEGIRGMKAGGTRRIVIPPKLAYVEGCKEGNPGPIPAGLGPKQQINTRKTEPLTFEVKVTKIR